MSNIEPRSNPIVEVQQQLEVLAPKFKVALPEHIPVERFIRVGQTAINNNPDLVKKCDRNSLFNAFIRAAQDGLLPNGKEGAIVPYKGQAQWLVMIEGIRKKVRNSGEISTWEVTCVYANDQFEFELGDAPFIKHKPALANRGELIAAYSVAKLKDGSLSREIMGIEEIEGIRSKSKAEFGPWNDAVFYPEMVKKTVARRHSKVLPMSTDLEDIIRRDDELYDLTPRASEASKLNGGSKQTLTGKLDTLAGLPAPATNGAAAPATERHTEAEDTATVDTLLAAIKELPTIMACVDWFSKNSANISHLSDAEGNAVTKAMLARQKEIARPDTQEAPQESDPIPFNEIPAMLRRTQPKNNLAAG